MKLNMDNILRIEKMLITKNGVVFKDIRIEILDHLATELEQKNGSFEEVFPVFFESRKDFINNMNIQLNKQSTKTAKKQLFKTIVSLKFMAVYILAIVCTIGIVYLKGKVWFLENFDFMPIVIPIPICAITLYSLFTSKRLASTISVVGVTSTILLTYLFLFIHIVRKATTLYWIPVYSFFITIAFVFYFIYFQSIKVQNKKFNTLKNTLQP